MADAGAHLLRLGPVHDVGGCDGELPLDDLTRLPLALRLHVLRLDVDVLAQNLTALGEDLHHLGHLPLVRARDDHDLVVRLDVELGAHGVAVRVELLLLPLLLLLDTG